MNRLYINFNTFEHLLGETRFIKIRKHEIRPRASFMSVVLGRFVFSIVASLLIIRVLGRVGVQMGW